MDEREELLKLRDKILQKRLEAHRDVRGLKKNLDDVELVLHLLDSESVSSETQNRAAHQAKPSESKTEAEER